MSKLYKYDPETLEYHPVRRTPWFYLFYYRYHILLTLVLAGGFVALYYANYDSEQTALLRRDNERIEAYVARYKDTIAVMKQRLAELQEMDKQLYRTILDAEPVDADSVANAPDTLADLGERPQDIEMLEDIIAEMEERMVQSVEQQRMINEVTKNNKEDLRKIPSIRPIASEILAGFGEKKNPITKKKKFHSGVDFKANIGEKVRATGDGYVAQRGIKPNGYGQYVMVVHSHGFSSVYACLSQIQVAQGQRVKRGDVIGLSGSSGLSKGPHLHYEVYKNGRPVDPLDFFFADLKPEEFVRYKEKAAAFVESMD